MKSFKEWDAHNESVEEITEAKDVKMFIRMLDMAISMNASKPEFRKASAALEDYGNTFGRSYATLKKTNAVVNELFTKLEESLDARIESDK